MARTGVLALVGSESLAGREIRDLLSGNTLGQDLKLIAALGEEVGKLTEQGGEPAILAPFEESSVDGADVIFLAGSAESTEKARKLAPQAHLIDLTARDIVAADGPATVGNMSRGFTRWIFAAWWIG